MTFSLELRRFAEKAKHDADQVVGAIIGEIAAELDKRSPVGDAVYWKSKPPKGYIGGHFRANWQLGIGVRPSGEVAGVDPSGSRTLGNIVSSIPEQAAGKLYFLANNTPYARRIEDGYSRQAPQGIVALTQVMFQTIVRNAVEGKR